MQTEELTMDGVPYELVAYPVDAEQFAAEWRCKNCDESDGVSIRGDGLKNALDIARFSLIAHHQVSHQGVAKLIDLGFRGGCARSSVASAGAGCSMLCRASIAAKIIGNSAFVYT